MWCKRKRSTGYKCHASAYQTQTQTFMSAVHLMHVSQFLVWRVLIGYGCAYVRVVTNDWVWLH